MTRRFKDIAEAAPRNFLASGDQPFDLKAVRGFTAAETAHIATEYGKLCRFARLLHSMIQQAEHGSKKKRRYYRLWVRTLYARGAFESKFREWESMT